ncbi:MAG: hypothetical protein LBV05_06200 [Comamonas sp.]|jgi:hypothetical protein|uniref:hypothetical protein n=1 Tax=Comamonas sp. TaxID=34028 RepID=UPI0026010C51|nr:hypothetical protein [Comamonas sp.]MDR3065093.1 hypothetical protein [Comamonas sp.]
MNRFYAHCIAVLTTLVTIAACQPPEDRPAQAAHLKEPTIYFRNGLEIALGGISVPVRGVQQCPYALAAPAGTVVEMNDAKCIRLSDDTEQIVVMLEMPEGVVQEAWTVRRDAPSKLHEPAFKNVSLLRPDGTRITLTDKSDRLLDKCYEYQAAHVCI